MATGIYVFIGFVAGLIVMFFLRADAVKYARAAEAKARSLAIDAQNVAQGAKDELDKIKNGGATLIHDVEHAGAAAGDALRSDQKS